MKNVGAPDFHLDDWPVALRRQVGKKPIVQDHGGMNDALQRPLGAKESQAMSRRRLHP